MNSFLRRVRVSSVVWLVVAGGCWVDPVPLPPPDNGGSAGYPDDGGECGSGGSGWQGAGGYGASAGKGGAGGYGGSGGYGGKGGSGGYAGGYGGSGGYGGVGGSGGGSSVSCRDKYEKCSGDEGCAMLVACAVDCTRAGLELSEMLPLCLDYAGIEVSSPSFQLAFQVNGCMSNGGACEAECSVGNAGSGGGGDDELSCPPSKFVPPAACDDEGVSACVACQCAN
ncbi:MAG TPA: hypothetical protein VFS00_31215 [Polyangiaceae bacterium]|nr:hypothetical protein [Polyangiaceae bacterium]